uniref:Cysteine proteinase inhibitor B-like n=1 Tax=Tanacetum cinerariifolium TaxID=118510 RepID=A0A699J3H2_TANCI|nr:cysteine proteinase inhibitor B-like [Tanacetum cinerariifolium]
MSCTLLQMLEGEPPLSHSEAAKSMVEGLMPHFRAKVTNVGVYLPDFVFSLDMFYLALSKRISRATTKVSKVEDVTTNKEVQAVGKYSVEEYNRLRDNKENDGQLMFVKVVKAEKQVVSGMKYYLNIEAVNKNKWRS